MQQKIDWSAISPDESEKLKDELVEIWEASVRSTHHFLAEKDIRFFKPLVRDKYIPVVELYTIRNEQNRIAAFMGLSDELIEMLFVHPEEQGKGYGKQLIEFAIHNRQIFKVDVNEQNEKATSFYLNRGFDITGRDETDPSGNPFPILHLSLNEITLLVSDDSLEIRQILLHKKRFLDLLLLADEQESMIDLYLERGEMFALYDRNILRAICVVTNEGNRTIELKNIATDPQYQRQGYGKRLIRFLFEHYSGKYDTLLVGTGESPLTVPFYEQNGFRYSHRIKNFFTDNYDHPIFEDGKQLVDMIYLRKKLSE
nr:GNAT family N-acetyltransferase [uncultured Parabacteroides sp.]